MKNLLSSLGKLKYASLHKAAEPVNPKQKLDGKSLNTLLTPPVKTPAKKGKSNSPRDILERYMGLRHIGKYNASMPSDDLGAKLNKVRAANPELELPGKMPPVKGISLGWRF